MMMAPGWGIGALSRAAAPATTAAPIFVRGVGWVPGATTAPSWLGRAIQGTGKMAEGAVQGAEAGAIATPEDPESGAISGAVGGAIPTPLGAFARSSIGRRLGGTLPPAIATGAGLAALDALYGGGHAGHSAAAGTLAHLIIRNISWHGSPVGGTLYRLGNRIMDSTGRVIGSIPPGLAAQLAAKGFGNFGSIENTPIENAQ